MPSPRACPPSPPPSVQQHCSSPSKRKEVMLTWWRVRARARARAGAGAGAGVRVRVRVRVRVTGYGIRVKG